MKIPKTKPIDFDKLFDDMAHAREVFGETACTKMKGKQQQDFQQLLGMIDDKVDELKTQLPETQQFYANKIQEMQQKLADVKGKQAELNEKIAQAKEELEKRKNSKPELPEVPEKPVAPHLGSVLREELLAKYAPQPKTAPPVAGVAWQDWNLDGSWLSNDTPQ